ncbi:MAG TPA: ABC transporter permease subunit/CPBP intramembrane protease [Candidatus Paceibacterota bacterium]|nr:ABC transporter permease subunit/CPBP intramembrane protease [Verrucomicrobiota bacterium]HRY48385.1 ABC transporter permease subunit/CPBP intramembrane protease [Candidatus Paceibacterota bacterium]HSA00685.1 ABC transporter permease subunit/CPBP intramembrane protease [Candidatus Paceibacterota bacterium]
MRWGIVLVIFLKELRESLRDRRTLIMMIGLPILLYPALSLFVGSLVQSRQASMESRTSQIAVWGNLPAPLSDHLKRHTNILLQPWLGISEVLRKDLESDTAEGLQAVAPTNSSSMKPDRSTDGEMAKDPFFIAARSLLTERKADAVLIPWPGIARALDRNGLGQVSIYSDSVRGDSREAERRLTEALRQYRRALVAEREQILDLEPGFGTGLQINNWNVAPNRRQTGLVLGSLLPFLLIVLTASSGIYAAIDLTAGEKERNTMQTLLCAPIHCSEVIGGKFLAVWSISLLAALANFASVAATTARMLPSEMNVQVGLSTYLLAFLLLIPVAFIVSAVYLAVAVFARDFKDGQNFLTPVIFLVMFPGAITLIPDLELNVWNSFIPLANIALLIKALFMGELQAELVFLTLISCVAHAGLALLLASRVFAREQILLGGHGTFSTLFSRTAPRNEDPSPALAAVVYGFLITVVFYGSLLLQDSEIITSVVVSELGFFLLPVVLLTLALGFSPRRTFALGRPTGAGLLAAVLIGGSAWTFIGGILIRLLPPPESFVKAMEKILLLRQDTPPLWTVWLVLALIPAVCEEFFFRGFILAALRRLGRWPAILISALLFGLAHASIYRLLPTLCLGVLLGWLVWKTGSISCGILAHALNNGIPLTLLNTAAQDSVADSASNPFLPWSLTLAGSAVLMIGILLLAAIPARPEDSSSPDRTSRGPIPV